MKTLIIAEKPSVGRAIAEALGGFRAKDGYLESDQYLITWAFGHLVTLAEPEEYDAKWKKWRLETLPILPDTWAIRPIDADAKKQLKRIAELAKQCQTVINACDAGREGELIFRYIWEVLRLGKTHEMKRLWVSSLTPEAIRQALADLRPGKEYDRLYLSALARARGDWLVGMNATRAFSILFRNRAGGVLSLGRVQTPTLSVLVQREREIRNFKPETFYELYVTLQNGTLFTAKWVDKSGNPRLRAEDAARAIAAKLEGAKTATVVASEVQEVKEVPPQLYDLTLLQREANVRYGLTAEQTLKALQNLYEGKYVTYPRTDSRYVPPDIAKTFPQLLAKLLATAPYSDFRPLTDVKRAMSSKRVVDAAKVSDHHAILPTGSKVGELPGVEGKIYDLVVRRFLANCMPPAVDQRTKLELDAAGERLVASGKLEIEVGWRAVEPKSAPPKKEPRAEESAEESSPVPPLKVGDKAQILQVSVHKGQTKPPQPYTEARLLAAMENAGKDLEDEAMREALKGRGLGTPATRAAIIERLKGVGYVTVQGKQLRPTPKGELLIELVEKAGIEILASPELTGDWELRLNRIAEGKDSASALENDLKDFVRTMVQKIKSLPQSGKGEDGSAAGDKPYLAHTPCPICGQGQVEVTEKRVFCTTAGCTLRFSRVICRLPLPEAEIENLLVHGRTSELDGFYSERTGKTFSTYLVLKPAGDGVEFGFALEKGEKAAPAARTSRTVRRTPSSGRAGRGRSRVGRSAHQKRR